MAVNGQVVTQMGTRADPETDKITVDGKPIESGQKRLYILLNKPVGYTCTRFDRFAEKTVLELVSSVGSYLYPVGRLDVNTSGLIILTDDGDFAQLLTHPSHEIDKAYIAVVGGRVTPEALSRLRKGVELDDGLTAPAKARLVLYSTKENTSKVELVIHEGRKRQVRRMLQKVGHRVRSLVRVRLGSLELGDLAEGDYRFLSNREVTELKKLASPKKKTRKERK